MIPLLPSGLEMEGDEIFKLTSKDGEMSIEKEKVPVAAPAQFTSEMIFEQEPSQLLNAILPLYLNGQILRTLQESVASELAARMSHRTAKLIREKNDNRLYTNQRSIVFHTHG